LRTIAIVVTTEPRHYSVVNSGNPAFALALVGGIFVAAEQDRKEAKLYQAMQFEKFSLKSVLAAQLAAKLKAAGYEVRIAERPGEAPADATLVVVPLQAGFTAASAVSDYLPSLAVHARLIAADGRTELYRALHACGSQRPRGDGWRYTPAARGFNDFDALMAKPAASAAALAESAAAVASTIAGDLGQAR